MPEQDSRGERVRITRTEDLSRGWSLLQRTTFELRRRDGSWQTQTRETYDRGHGVAILPIDRTRGTVLLIRQFRFPAYYNGEPGDLIEVPAGKLDLDDPAEQIRRECEEETGHRVRNVREVFSAYMSPGSVTERLHFYLADYDAHTQVNAGGGLEHEGEDIEVLELPLPEALKMIERGEIQDGKTIMLLQYAALLELGR